MKYLLGGRFLHHIRDVGSGLVDVPVRVHPAGQPAVITVPDLKGKMVENVLELHQLKSLTLGLLSGLGLRQV